MRYAAVLQLLFLCLAAPTALADYDSGEDAYQRGDFRRAVAELTPVASQDARAARLLAQMHARGEGVTRDPHQALLWLRTAGELGDPAAQFELGNAYASGRDAPLDPREAVVWYTRAAEQGHAGAEFELGKRYARGDGVLPDANQANYWIGRAVAADLPQARAWVGLGHAQPEPAPPSRDAAPRERYPEPAAEEAHETRPGADTSPYIHWHWGMSYGCCGPGPYWGWHSWRWYPYSGSSVHFGVVIQN
jgi:TPR repeat protein